MAAATASPPMCLIPAHVPYKGGSSMVVDAPPAAERAPRGQPGPPWPGAGDQGQRTSGGSDIRIASTLPPVFSPNSVPRSCSRLNST